MSNSKTYAALVFFGFLIFSYSYAGAEPPLQNTESLGFQGYQTLTRSLLEKTNINKDITNNTSSNSSAPNPQIVGGAALNKNVLKMFGQDVSENCGEYEKYLEEVMPVMNGDSSLTQNACMLFNQWQSLWKQGNCDKDGKIPFEPVDCLAKQNAVCQKINSDLKTLWSMLTWTAEGCKYDWFLSICPTFNESKDQCASAGCGGCPYGKISNCEEKGFISILMSYSGNLGHSEKVDACMQKWNIKPITGN